MPLRVKPWYSTLVAINSSLMLLCTRMFQQENMKRKDITAHKHCKIQPARMPLECFLFHDGVEHACYLRFVRTKKALSNTGCCRMH